MDIVHEQIARATPDRVYEVLSDPARIAAWYTDDLQAEARVGSVAEFRFNRGVIRVEIAALVPNEKVVWKILQGLPGWEGVTGEATWRLSPYEENTMVHFTHSGWPTMDGPYPSTNSMWGKFFWRMKSLAETGVASPA
jgi:uncharacterized protein YndB with AHSA1/START domain